MSTLSEKSQRWRRLGLLKYLASELGRTVKQVTRYWDSGLIPMPNRYRTPGGARRVRYTDDTVEHVRRAVKMAKETNIEIRYRIGSVSEMTYKGTTVPVQGCNSMDDLYRRARQAGLSKKDADNFAYRSRIGDPEPSPDQIASQTFWVLKCTSEEEVADSMRDLSEKLSCIPLESLIEETDPAEFRARASDVWRNICSRQTSGLPDLKTMALLRDLLSQQDRHSFVRKYFEITELENRIMEIDDATFDKTHERAAQAPDQLQLEVAALKLRQQGRSPSGSAMAEMLKVSRGTLYRRFGGKAIQDALSIIRDDAHAARECRNDKWARGKNLKSKSRTRDSFGA